MERKIRILKNSVLTDDLKGIRGISQSKKEDPVPSFEKFNKSLTALATKLKS